MLNNKYLSCLEKNLFFADIEKQCLQNMSNDLFEEIHFQKNDVIIEESTEGDKIYLIISGEVIITKNSQSDNPITIAYRHDGDFIGEMALFENQKRSAQISCLTPVSVLMITKDNFFYIINQIEGVKNNVIKAITSKLRETCNKILEHDQKSTEIIHLRNKQLAETTLLLGTIIELNQEIIEQKKELEIKNRELYRLAITDKLTNIYNRTYLIDVFQKEFSKSRRHQIDLSCIIIDIDFFKSINDKYGHQVGDLVLKQTVDTISQQIRKEDIFGRYGGEEFLLILPHTNIEHARLLGEKIRKSIENMDCSIGGCPIHVTISSGISDNHINQPKNEDAMLYNADLCLYEAKRTGRNRTVLFSLEFVNRCSC